MAIATLPHISISPAPPEEPMLEPYSPFSWEISPIDYDDDDFRPRLLTPPATGPTSKKPLSPLRPSNSPVVGKGLERERFEALLRASRERNSAVGAKKTPDLRKEIALKAHKNKQVERRALFLSKVLAPPSPTATSLPKTPPDSPAIFHYTLPSPGLESPLALFESLETSPPSCKPWVEQVDFRLPADGTFSARRVLTPARSSALPSLDEISARLARTSPNGSATRLPAFLANVRQTQATERPTRLPMTVGRLQMPVRTPKARPQALDLLPPKSPCSPLLPKLEITTLVVPCSSSLSPIELTETNLLSLDSRERRARDMFTAIRRRVAAPSDNGLNGHEENMERRLRRRSAPGDLGKPRTGFEHPVLAMPGGF
jgi:hypothetical protein